MRNQENLYWYMAYCRIVAGHDQEGLEWADRAVVAEGAVPSDREELLLSSRTAASFRLGDVNSAKRLAGQLNDHYPFDTWRGRVPNDRDSETDRTLPATTSRYASVMLGTRTSTGIAVVVRRGRWRACRRRRSTFRSGSDSGLRPIGCGLRALGGTSAPAQVHTTRA